MARRPDVHKQMLTQDDLADLQRSLSQMSVTSLMDFYQAAHLRCQLHGDQAPAARSIQELVQAWKQMRKWR